MAALKTLAAPLATTWPCLTEASRPAEAETLRTRALMQRYADVPMDLADASRVAAAEVRRLRRIFTLDSDFRVYRIGGVIPFDLIP